MYICTEVDKINESWRVYKIDKLREIWEMKLATKNRKQINN